MKGAFDPNVTELLAAHEPPCLSLYQPTHRHLPESRQDPIRFRNLVRSMEASLRSQAPDGTEALMAPFKELAADQEFWSHSLDGLAVLAARNLFRVYRLQRSVPEVAVVADSFHVKPLIRIVQSADRYQILGLNREAVRLFEGNRDSLDEVPLAPGVPRTLTDALGEETTEPHLTVASYGGPSGPMRHGHGSKKDEVAVDTERFFRVVDRAILQHHSGPSGLPLLLAALPEHHTPFRQVSQNPHLLAAGIDVHPESVSLDALRARAWQAMAPLYQARLATLVEAFGTAFANGTGDSDASVVARAAVAGRVLTLLVEADRRIPGRIDPATGAIETGAATAPDVDDLLDDIGEIVLRKGGEVVIVPAAQMPAPTGLAAIYRF